MDPDKALQDARIASRSLREDETWARSDAEALADAFDALDEWLTGGGFLPQGWRR